MKISLKPDAIAFQQHLETLRQFPWLQAERRWWTLFLFRFEQIENAVKILRTGEVLSRASVGQIETDFHDSASPDIIQHTDDKWKNYVRFYFRPKTPTLYHNEGFRPRKSQQLNAHCPVPIYFLFDFASIISRADAQFSIESLARAGVEVYSTLDKFKEIPFKWVYHDEGFSPEDREKIIGHRQAEVIIPDRLNLDYLRYIVCRSQAEKEMLRYLLPDLIWHEWRNQILVREKHQFFHQKWLYIKQATLTDTAITFQLNLPEKIEDSGTFDARLAIHDIWTNQTYPWHEQAYIFHNSTQEFSLPTPSSHYIARFFLDDQLAFIGEYQKEDIPF